MGNSRRCDVLNVNVQRTSMQKHLRSKKHLESKMVYTRSVI